MQLVKILNARGETVFIIPDAVTAIEPHGSGSSIRLPGHAIFMAEAPEAALAAIEAAADAAAAAAKKGGKKIAANAETD